MMPLPTRRPPWAGCRRFVRPSSQAKDWTEWSPPALVLASPAARSDVRNRHPRAQIPIGIADRMHSSQRTGLRDGVTPLIVQEIN